MVTWSSALLSARLHSYVFRPQVSPLTNTHFAHCLCDHLTAFGSDFAVPPNTIDFAAAYSNLGAKLRDNFAVLVFVCCCLGIYLVLVVWARRMDRRDVQKVGEAGCRWEHMSTFGRIMANTGILRRIWVDDGTGWDLREVVSVTLGPTLSQSV